MKPSWMLPALVIGAMRHCHVRGRIAMLQPSVRPGRKGGGMIEYAASHPFVTFIIVLVVSLTLIDAIEKIVRR